MLYRQKRIKQLSPKTYLSPTSKNRDLRFLTITFTQPTISHQHQSTHVGPKSVNDPEIEANVIVLVPVTDLTGYEDIYEESQLIIPITKPSYNEESNFTKDGSMDAAERFAISFLIFVFVLMTFLMHCYFF